jgi:cyclophilin family peptidyl-prolyl cis-trans isomerase
LLPVISNGTTARWAGGVGAVAVFGVLCALAARVPTRAAEAPSPRVRIRTSVGAVTVELYPREAPRTVARFLARAGLGPKPEGIPEVVAYAGLALCESRAFGFFVLGCLPFDASDGRPARAPGREPPLGDEIDAVAMGLGDRKIASIPERDWLWQREIFPRSFKLEEAGRPVPAGLSALVQAVEREGTGAMTRLDGMSRQAYLEAVGYRFTRGASRHRVTRGALATANFWPGEADERFLLALADLPDRDGRATVFGRVLEGWDTLDAIARIPVDKGHRPKTPVTITGMEWAR